MYLCNTTDQYVSSGMRVILYLSRQKWTGALEEKSMFRAHILHPEEWRATFLLHECSELQRTELTLQEAPQTRSFV